MNPYTSLSSGLGTNEATALSERLTAWHEAMVAHERRLRSGTTSDPCDDECPHAEAPALWSEAIVTFGARAQELTFLRSRALDTRRSVSTIAVVEVVNHDVPTSARGRCDAVTRSSRGASRQRGFCRSADRWTSRRQLHRRVWPVTIPARTHGTRDRADGAGRWRNRNIRRKRKEERT